MKKDIDKYIKRLVFLIDKVNEKEKELATKKAEERGIIGSSSFFSFDIKAERLEERYVDNLGLYSVEVTCYRNVATMNHLKTNITTKLEWGGHDLSVFDVFDEYIRDEGDLSCLVSFFRSAYKIGNIRQMKFRRKSVIVKVPDFLSFTVIEDKDI